MKTIKIKLNNDFKQFRSRYEAELHGDLIILSGVNGSGKSQLMQIIAGNIGIPPKTNSIDIPKFLISSEVYIDDEKIPFSYISRRSFKDNIGIMNFEHPEAINLVWHKEQAWIHFSHYNKWINAINYSKCKEIISDIIKENRYNLPTFNQSRPNNTLLNIDENTFKELLPRDFIWEVDDPFVNTIASMFYESAAKRVMIKSEHGDGQREGLFDNHKFLETAPWTILNRIFETLRFSYRFKTDIEFEMPTLKEPPTLYTFSNGVIDESRPRQLSELSDGEKTIINLTFALLNEKARPDRVLLLDEIDNTLNPSLVESLFMLLDEYFIKNDVVVIMSTHSPATISLAPDNSIFYEMFRQDNASPIIKPVGREEYEELRIANREFYSRMENNEHRILELEAKYQEFKSYTKILFVEDTYTQIYKLAWLMLNREKPTIENMESEFDLYADFKIFGKGNKDNLYGYLNNPNMQECENQRIIGLFDFDDAYRCFKDLKNNNGWGDIEGIESEGLYRMRDGGNIFAMVLPVPEHRKTIAKKNQTVKRLEVELLFSDEQIKKIYPGDTYATEHIISDLVIPKINNKKDFWKKALDLETNDFQAFKPLFDKVSVLFDINL
ncbi:MAG: hypothetical protein CVU97_02735 [Firmicutes bacterium HGW-Firmicutes-21]|nr:MAG: hypothetical protein CVU97_02735 [Firmicutes bacterium HGW-Firmicutes-21]